MSRQTLDLVTTICVLLSGMAAAGLLCYDLYLREAAGNLGRTPPSESGTRPAFNLRQAGLALTAVFLVLVAWRFIGLAG